MAHQRHASTTDALKTPHSALGIAPTASLAYPSSRTDDKFILSPVLNLPEAFGSAYVGETFSCTLCANNEIETGNTSKAISGVRIQAEMQTPSVPNGTSLELFGHDRNDRPLTKNYAEDIGPGLSLQKILRFELKEEGNHVLAVTVTYTETALAGEGRPTGGKVRTFRKLYQFVAQQLLSVRTKAGELAPGRHLLEAQLENMGEGAVSLEDVSVNPNEIYNATSLNWDLDLKEGVEDVVKPVLMAREVIQVAFLLEEKTRDKVEEEERKDQLGDNRKVLGQLAIQWRTGLGDRGTLSTGWLTARR
ncbi:hypothetical protein SLS60_000631 [Paraconiothyrium brasiliense]|uniref:Uncharacterized protein n=1 Tax=Paraconiothyrium brasiliense TaxID=300254 RepID=A0ABR3S6X3_9PLEO